MGKTSRRQFLMKTMAAGAAAGLISAAEKEEAQLELPSLMGRKILFTFGGWDGHEPVKFKEYLSAWLTSEGAEVQTFDSLEPYANKAMMDTVDLVLQIFTMSKISPEQEKGLLEAVERNGTGIAGWHGGLCDAFRNNPDYQYMTGGQWVAHPGGVIDYKVDITNHRDPVTAGLSDFNMHSEQYYMHTDPNVKVLATTRFSGQVHSWIDGCIIPVTWKKMHGKGRVFYTSVGHNLDHIVTVPDAIEMLKRGIRWASGSKYLPAEKWINPAYKS